MQQETETKEKKAKMKVIFLDIDGVMNSHVFYEKRHKKISNRLKRAYNRTKNYIKYVLNGFKHDYSYHHIPKPYNFNEKLDYFKKETCPQKWKWLSSFCNEHDIKICISSVWKYCFKSFDDWNKALMKLGFNDGMFVGITGDRKTLRGTEIKEWMEGKDIENYAILDDDSDMLPEQRPHFYLVDGWFGLTPNHLYRINILFEEK